MKSKTIRQCMALLAASLLVSLATLAAPAAWYKWKSKLNGEVWCTQISPGDGWIKSSGPYKDANCKVDGRPSKQ